MKTPMQTSSPSEQSREHRAMMGMKSHGLMGHTVMNDHAAGSPIMTRMIFALIDADGDGAISLSEFQTAHERLFKAMDSNKDGKLTPDDMVAFMPSSMGGPAQR